MLPAPEARDIVKLLLFYTIYLRQDVILFLKVLSAFLLETNTERQPHAGQARCQFHLPIHYHHLDNAG